jgi:DNA-binding Xre family transcriptional regulator
MDVRVRLPELLTVDAEGKTRERKITPYALAKRSTERISLSTAYRLVKRKGQLESFESKLLEALCDVLDVEPGELLERDKKRGRKA